MKKVIPYLRIIRPINCLIAMTAVWVGALLTWLEPVIVAPLVVSLATFFVCASGNIVNDIVDIPIDRINRPQRVLVQQLIPIRSAYIYSVLLNIVALGMALTINIYTFLSAFTAICLLYLYNYKAKQVPIIGNIIIALLAGMVFLTGGLAVNFTLTFTLPGPLVGALFAFLFHLVREVVKDIEDIDGDLQAGIKTLPIIFGKRPSVAIAMSIFFILTLCTYIPIFKGWYSDTYKYITVYAVDFPILIFLIFLWGNPTQKMLKVASLILKIGMALGIVALIFY